MGFYCTGTQREYCKSRNMDLQEKSANLALGQVDLQVDLQYLMELEDRSKLQ